VSIAAACAVPLAAHATNGYFLPGYGAAAVGMGGVGVAFAQDSISAATNPAGVIDVGSRADLGFGIFNPERSAAIGRSAGGASPFGYNKSADSSNRYYMMPSAGFTMAWDDKLTFGVALVGNGGMNTTYKPNFFAPGAGRCCSQTVGIDLMQMLVPITAAYKIDEHNAVGASLVLGAQRFAARGLQSFGIITSDSAHLTNNGHDFAQGAGLRLGWRGKYLDDKVTLGATYASKVYMSKFGKYRGLFAEGGSFDVPANYALGIAIKATPATTIAFDVERILYAGVASVHNPGPGPGVGGSAGTIPAFVNPAVYNLGLDNGMGFGWTNQTVYKLGVAYQYNPHWVLRAGYNYGKSPIPDSELAFNTLAPATVEKHYTMGFTYSPNKSSEMTLAYLRAASNTQSACDLAMINCARIQMYQNDLEFSYAWKF
jgi:long-chain fatty acid transport protein